MQIVKPSNLSNCNWEWNIFWHFAI